jgi:hypothetical protein
MGPKAAPATVSLCGLKEPRHPSQSSGYCRGDECESVAKARVRVLYHRVDWQVEGVVRRECAMTRGLMIGATTVLASMESSV